MLKELAEVDVVTYLYGQSHQGHHCFRVHKLAYLICEACHCSWCFLLLLLGLWACKPVQTAEVR